MNDDERHRYAKHRLFVTETLTKGQDVILNRAQNHYLAHVVRAREGGAVRLFNGRDGEWACEISALGKREAVVRAIECLREQVFALDLWLVFAPLKKAATDFVVEKAVELGVSRLCPVFTEFTNAARVNTGRLRAQAIEAAEQCDRLDVPEVAEGVKLGDMLADWPAGRALYFANEHLGNGSPVQALAGGAPGPAAVLIGPEGGFSACEVAAVEALDATVPVSLGPRILRADTASVAMLALWQAHLGDWR